MHPKVCYLDMDGVLVDFVGGALAMHGKTLPPAEVRWDFLSQVGLSGDAFWSPLGFDFWANLGWTAEGGELLATLERLFGEEHVVLLTSPCETEGGVEGKVAWIRKHLPGYRRRFLVGPPKHLAAGPGKILVDDHDENCERFAAYGGRSVVVPRPWNRMRASTDALGRFDVGELAETVARLIAL